MNLKELRREKTDKKLANAIKKNYSRYNINKDLEEIINNNDLDMSVSDLRNLMFLDRIDITNRFNDILVYICFNSTNEYEDPEFLNGKAYFIEFTFDYNYKLIKSSYFIG